MKESFANIEVEKIEDLKGLFRIQNEWRELWKRCPSSTPFQSPDWILHWLKYWPVQELRILAFWKGARLKGFVPFHISEENNSHRTLKLIGGEVADYLDGLIEGEVDHQVLAYLEEYLSFNAKEWNEIDWQQLRPESPLLAVKLPSTFESIKEIQDFCPVISLPQTVADLGCSISKRLGYSLKSAKRRLSRYGRLTFEYAATENIIFFLEQLSKLHQLRWNLKGQPGAFENALIQSFHQDVAQSFLESGALRLLGLFLDGRIISILYGFSHLKKTYYYLSGFDPEFFAYSVGSLAIAEAIARSIQENCDEFHFLRGQEPYKYRWGAQNRANFRRIGRHGGSSTKYGAKLSKNLKERRVHERKNRRALDDRRCQSERL